MKIHVFLIVIIFCIVYTHERKPIEKLTELGAVTRFEGIERYYQILQQEKSEIPPRESRQPEKNMNIKKSICRSIFTSDFVDMYQEDWIDLDLKDNRMELKNEYQDIFKSIYKEYRTLCLPFVGDSCFSYRYENNYKSLPVSIDGSKRDEYVFMCLVRDRRSRKIKPYFVSQEYDINDIGTYPMAGRFIFTYNYNNGTRSDELMLWAMAEEPAMGWNFLSRFIEMYYVTERSANRPRSSSRRNNSRMDEMNRSDNRKNHYSALNNKIESNGANAGGRHTVSKKLNTIDIEMNTGKNNTTKLSTTNGKNNTDDANKSYIGNSRNTSADRSTNNSWIDNDKSKSDQKLDTDKSSMALAWNCTGIGRSGRDVNKSINYPVILRSRSNENKDPMCQLTAGEKLRLCTTIFASSVFRAKVKFVPTIDNVQLNCEKKQISFNAEVANPLPFMARITQWEIRESGRKTYEESMIGCRAFIKGKNYKMTYLVSRGNYGNSVFVYTHKFSDRRVFLYNYLNNTSVI